MVGAGFLVLADVIARTVLSPAELPIGVVTAFFGAPFFAVVLRRSRWVGLVNAAIQAQAAGRSRSAAPEAVQGVSPEGRAGEWVALFR